MIFQKSCLFLFLATILSIDLCICQNALSTHSTIVADRKGLESDLDITKAAIHNLSGQDKLEEYDLLKLYIYQSQKLNDLLNEENNILKSDLDSNRVLVDIISKTLIHKEKQHAEVLKLMFRQKLIRNDWLMLFSSESFHKAWLKYKYVQQLQNFSTKEKEQYQNLKKLHQDIQQKINEQLINIKHNKNNLELLLLNLKEEEGKLSVLIKNLRQQKKTTEQKLRRKELNKKNTSQKIQNERKRQFSLNSVDSDKVVDDEALKNLSFSSKKQNLPWPVEYGFVIEQFGKKPHAIVPNVWIENNGIGIMTQPGENVKAIHKGIVKETPVINNEGQMIILEHGDYLTSYFTLATIFVSKGDQVSEGQVIGTISKSRTKPSLLHFEIWKGYEKLNPENWLEKKRNTYGR